jgi:hypothetical protein
MIDDETSSLQYRVTGMKLEISKTLSGGIVMLS